MRTLEAQMSIEDGINRVTANASTEWINRVYDILRQEALTHEELIADDIWAIISTLEHFPSQHEPSAMGSVVRKAIKEGIIKIKPGVYQESRRPDTHGRPIRVWQSLICYAAAPLPSEPPPLVVKDFYLTIPHRENPVVITDADLARMTTPELAQRYNDLDAEISVLIKTVGKIAKELADRKSGYLE